MLPLPFSSSFFFPPSLFLSCLSFCWKKPHERIVYLDKVIDAILCIIGEKNRTRASPISRPKNENDRTTKTTRTRISTSLLGIRGLRVTCREYINLHIFNPLVQVARRYALGIFSNSVVFTALIFCRLRNFRLVECNFVGIYRGCLI